MNSLQPLLPPDRFSLSSSWELLERPLTDGPEAYAAIAPAPATCTATVPGDVNGDLFNAGLLPDPLVALNASLYAERVPFRSWWYRCRFVTPASRIDGSPLPPFAELRLSGLDIHADIWLNDTPLGHHESAFIPFSADVTRLLRPAKEENLLIVRLTTGREIAESHPNDEFPLVSAVPTEADRGYPLRGYKKRVFLRKPAYSWGWDWSPALPTCGITAPAELLFHAEREIAHITLSTALFNDNHLARVIARVEVLSRRSPVLTTFGSIHLALTAPDGTRTETTAHDVLLRGGVTFIPLSLDIPEPALWWPNGAGDQAEYTVTATLSYPNTTTSIEPFQYGLRTVEQDYAPGLFRFKINGTPIFLQGGNWVPCDHLIGRTTPARLEHLVQEAANAHFNCLRVWGGGRYELEAFYRACDRLGILLWHDFMSACCALPYNIPSFADLCRREGSFQVRRLQYHASLLQWCGNNEVGQAHSWNPLFQTFGDPMDAFYFDAFPRIVATEAPGTPYLPTSPYGGENDVGASDVGDDHHWVVMRPDPQFWSHPEYWNGKDIPLFNSEYGYGGPCSLASTKQYLGTDTPNLKDAIGHEHTNTFYDIPRVDFSIAEHYGENPSRPLSEYILLGGLCQGLNLGYSLESLRANDHTWGGIFWMYNDSWGENGWTIIDYYLRRKISYYGVKRALAPQKLVLRRGGEAFGGSPNEILLLALNASNRPLHATVRAGFQPYDGSSASLQTLSIHLPPHALPTLIASFPRPSPDDLQHGTLMVYSDTPSLPSVAYRAGRHKDLHLPPAHPKILEKTTDGNDLLVTLTTDAFAHAVHLNLPDDALPSDHYFDLLPHDQRTIRIPNGAPWANTLSLSCIP